MFFLAYLSSALSLFTTRSTSTHQRVLVCVTAERPAVRTQGGRAEAADRSAPRRSWEPTAQLDGSPVDRYSISTTKPIRAQRRLAKAGRDKEARVPLLEDVGKMERESDSLSYSTVVGREGGRERGREGKDWAGEGGKNDQRSYSTEKGRERRWGR